MAYEQIPQELKDLRLWVCRKEKIPYCPSTGVPAKAGVPETWGTFSEAIAARGYDGIGFEFATGGSYIGVDLDTVRDPQTGRIAREAKEIISDLNSYTEISPSGYGFHIICKIDPRRVEILRNKAMLPENSIVRYDKNGKRKLPEIEIYKEKRYFTMTGNVYEGRSRITEQTAMILAELDYWLKPKPIDRPLDWNAPIEGISQQVRDSHTDEEWLQKGLLKDQKLYHLYNGDREFGDESRDDQALMNKLAYWCNGNRELMERAFRQSPYCQGKDDGHLRKMMRRDYLSRTMDTALQSLHRTAREDDTQYHVERVQGDFGEAIEHPPERKTPKLQWMADIEPKRAEYLIEPYIPKGRLTIIGGVSGAGKTWFTLKIASMISKGITSFERDTAQQSPGMVIYETKENDYECDVRTRLDVTGADLTKIARISTSIDGETNMPLSFADGTIDDVIREHRPALLVVDPLQSYLGEHVDMNQANKVRPILDRVMGTCMDCQCGTCFVMHMSKMINLPALDRLLGSSDFRNAARSVLIVGRDPEDDDSIIVAHAKNSLGPVGRSLRFHIDVKNGGLVFDGYCDLEADDIIPKGVKSTVDGRTKKKSDVLDQAVSDLEDLLGEDGWTTREQAYTLAAANGYSERSMDRAKKELELQTILIGYGDKKVGYWVQKELSREEFKAQMTTFCQTAPVSHSTQSYNSI